MIASDALATEVWKSDGFEGLRAEKTVSYRSFRG
jgi:hypothetical protein